MQPSAANFSWKICESFENMFIWIISRRIKADIKKSRPACRRYLTTPLPCDKIQLKLHVKGVKK